ncbi:hypothetical protein CFBP5875_00325 [Agrobacterium pusense]|uniref:STM4504/CBY_0614 family protein n=1 Tax=Agrobacterium pusense TaxID=648995 RepID=UPI0010BEF963|nr:hypothetical protein [Agrobacterium pusense]QCL83158.1 hypothetical protein CFBP5875_00325 [Agrobacterium pusense]
MAVTDIFSKRQRRLRGEMQDVFQYDKIPEKLRIQAWQILGDVLGGHGVYDRYGSPSQPLYDGIVKILRREYGVRSLPTGGRHASDEFYELEYFLAGVTDPERALDAIEVSFAVVNADARDHNLNGRRANEIADQAIEELNARFKENGVGYQFVDGEIIRVDSELVHTEAVKPAIRLLNTKDYAGPQEEFLSAYEHYRQGNNKEALNDCLKAFESTMKAICDKRGWTYKTTDTAKALIDVCLSNGLIPPFWQQQMASLRSLLESSIPTGRNKLSGHGQGAVPQEVPDYLTAYMLHMTASTLVFLTTAEKELK